MRASLVPIVSTLLAVACSGCGGGPTETYVKATVPVRGKVSYKGRPLAQGTVKFEPDSGRGAEGDIRPDGTFELSTFKAGDGAVEGTHRVAVVGKAKGGEAVPLKYRNASSSKVEIEVAPAKDDYNIDIR